MPTREIAASAHPAAQANLAVLQNLLPTPRAYAVELWNGSELPASEAARFCLILNHPSTLRRMFKPPIELSMGEASGGSGCLDRIS